jgi:hypothetical protein
VVDPRLYRTTLGVVLLALIVFGFSLSDQQQAVTTTLAPDAFSGGHAYAQMLSLAKAYPDRAPGSPGDAAIAADVASSLRHDQFTVSTTSFTARTAVGTRTLQTVVGTRTGISDRAIVVLSHRDASSSPGTADLSGTAVMLELGRVLSGATQHRTLMLVSTSGSVGAAGATQLADALAGTPVEAVIVLGDVAGTRVTQPIVGPWSNGQPLAPTLLRNTVAAAVSGQAALRPGATGLGGQLAHLAFPLTVTEQGPFGARGIPAVLLSVSGDRPPAPDAPTSVARISGLGRATLQTVDALDTGPAVPAPVPYLMLSGKIVPLWAVRLLVLALILPVLAATVDALARARRRGHALVPWLLWVLAGSVPFLVALGLVHLARAVGWLDAAPPGPVGPGGVPLDGSGITLLVAVAVVIVVSFIVLRPLCIRLATALGGRTRASGRTPESPAGDAAGVALSVVMCATTLVIWALNPFAAALVVPALHLWMWLCDARVRTNRPLLAVMVVVGLLPPALVVLYYVRSLGLSAVDVVWNGLLLVAGGHLGLLACVIWSVLLGCVASALVIMIRSRRERRGEDRVVTVRGPVTYAGPGSLGGTESTLRR